VNSKVSKTLARSRQHEQRALALRLDGWSITSIAEDIGLSRGGTHKALTRALERLAVENRHAAATLRDIELARMDKLLEAAMPLATAPNGEADVRAMLVIIKIGERRAKLLGLDVPEPIQITVDLPSLSEIMQRAESIERRLLALDRPARAAVIETEVAVH
jgi:hypothetical protein